MGLKETLVMIHADDAGLSHSQNQATIACLKQGVVNSYSIMVPCPAFEEIAHFALSHPEFDYGIHLTLTCEWHSYKFGPVLPVDQVSSLVNEDGYFYKTRQDVKDNAQPREVYIELKAQIEKALQLGLQPTHLDSHMYSVGVTKALFEVYLQLGREYKLPVLINKSLLQIAGIAIKDIGLGDQFVMEHAHFANFEGFKKNHLSVFYEDVLDTLSPGTHIVLIHPAFDDDEMKDITINHPNFGSAWRQMDYETFMNPEIKQRLKEKKVELITWKEISKRFKS